MANSVYDLSFIYLFIYLFSWMLSYTDHFFRKYVADLFRGDNFAEVRGCGNSSKVRIFFKLVFHFCLQLCLCP